MDISDSGEFARRLVAVGEVFDAKLSPAKQALYFEALRDVPFLEVARALGVAVKVCTFMPKPAELRTLALGDAEDQAEAAWMAFRHAMRTGGAYRSLVTHDAALGETVLAMFQGWPEACHADYTPEMWASKRKEFGRIYRVLKDRQLTGARYLPGIAEQQNAGRFDRFLELVEIEGTTIRQLRGDAVQQAKALIATQSTEFSSLQQIGAALKSFPASRSETA